VLFNLLFGNEVQESNHKEIFQLPVFQTLWQHTTLRQTDQYLLDDTRTSVEMLLLLAMLT